MKNAGSGSRFSWTGNLVADHPLLGGRWQQSLVAGHYEGILESIKPKVKEPALVRVSMWTKADQDVEVRDLASYELMADPPAEVSVAGGVA